MGKYSDKAFTKEELEIDEMNLKFKVGMQRNDAIMCFEKIMSLTNDVGYQVSTLGKKGLLPDSAHKQFSLVSEHQYLMTKSLEVATKLYDMVMNTIEGKNDVKD